MRTKGGKIRTAVIGFVLLSMIGLCGPVFGKSNGLFGFGALGGLLDGGEHGMEAYSGFQIFTTT